MEREIEIVKLLEAVSEMVIAKSWEGKKQESTSQRVQSFSYAR